MGSRGRGSAEKGFYRTANRHDFSLEPPARTLLDAVSQAGLDSLAVGKIFDIFAGRGTTEHVYNKSNLDGLHHTDDYAERDFHGLCFVNLVDFDMVYGHRRDVDGYAKALSEFDNDYDVFYAWTKDKKVSGGKTFREIISQYDYEGKLPEILAAVPTLTVLVPDWSWIDENCFSVKNWDTTIDQV